MTHHKATKSSVDNEDQQMESYRFPSAALTYLGPPLLVFWLIVGWLAFESQGNEMESQESNGRPPMLSARVSPGRHGIQG